MARIVKVAECHPNRKHFAKGKCNACYQREYQRIDHGDEQEPRIYRNHAPKCHPDRDYYAKGLCLLCYYKSLRTKADRILKNKAKAEANIYLVLKLMKVQFTAADVNRVLNNDSLPKLPKLIKRHKS